MNNYEKILTLTIEEMASRNVKLFYNRYLGANIKSYLTSDGSIFEIKEDAIQYELEWLKREVDN